MKQTQIVYLFEQLIAKKLINENLQNNLWSLISKYFTNIKVEKLDVLEYPDNNEINVQLTYSIINTGITDQVQISFT